MSQLALNLAPRLSYRAENFIVHAGVRDFIQAFHQRLSSASGTSGFFSCVVRGAKRSGKTHLSLFLQELAAHAGFVSQVVMASELNQEGSLPQFGPEEVPALIVDDLHQLIRSSPFVHLTERVRDRGGIIVWLVDSDGFERWKPDPHVQSRLRSATVSFEIGDPVDEEMVDTIRALGLQRGLKLHDRELRFLSTRVSRSIPKLEEYLNRLDQLSVVLGRPIGHRLVSDAI